MKWLKYIGDYREIVARVSYSFANQYLIFASVEPL